MPRRPRQYCRCTNSSVDLLTSFMQLNSAIMTKSTTQRTIHTKGYIPKTRKHWQRLGLLPAEQWKRKRIRIYIHTVVVRFDRFCNLCVHTHAETHTLICVTQKRVTNTTDDASRRWADSDTMRSTTSHGGDVRKNKTKGSRNKVNATWQCTQKLCGVSS